MAIDIDDDAIQAIGPADAVDGQGDLERNEIGEIVFTPRGMYPKPVLGLVIERHGIGAEAPPGTPVSGQIEIVATFHLHLGMGFRRQRGVAWRGMLLLEVNVVLALLEM